MNRDEPFSKRAEKRAQLESEHRPEVIRERLDHKPAASYLGDAVLGAIDGCVTTFAVVAGATGAGLSSAVVVIMGVANLLADGFSMAVSNYQANRTERENLERARREEEEHIRVYPEGEKEEIRQIFARKGFHGATLDHIVEVISADHGVWLDTMLREELGMQTEGPEPGRAALATFIAFSIAGALPLIPYLLPGAMRLDRFLLSCLITGAAFFVIGVMRGRVLERGAGRSGVETLLMGGAAAALAYIAAMVLRQFGVQ